MTLTAIVNHECKDLGVTFSDGDDTERTIIVSGTVKETGEDFEAAVLVDGNGNIIDTETPFDVRGVRNFEMACRLAAGESDSDCGLLEFDCREIVEGFLKQEA